MVLKFFALGIESIIHVFDKVNAMTIDYKPFSGMKNRYKLFIFLTGSTVIYTFGV